ncbi:recombinase RecT [Burkholderia multivorans]|uniref:recombinase RecT n=2 Tax=Burkholderia multivorans TaxID=87883 RepID=UPI001C24FADE|nr:recombinase RecT [Burkholderia multivorans]MBU9386592.1 recombinase RecT [Burkholderia multivorans]MBU9437025.1 recombinase RecT [Burkholderia multivorans]
MCGSPKRRRDAFSTIRHHTARHFSNSETGMSEQMSNEKQPQQMTPYHEFREKLNRGIRTEIAKALPPDIDVDRFIRTVLTSVQMNPDLLSANRQSLMNACMRAAQDGLMPDGREAVLNVYNTKVRVREGNREVERWVPMVQYLPMVRGILKVMRNSGEIAHIDAAAVYEKDYFRFTRGDDPKIEHEPYLGEDDPGKIIAAYVIARLTNGEVHREVMPRRDIEKTRLASKNATGANSPWTKWYDQMGIKAVIKRAAKLLPNSADDNRLDRVIEHDNEAMGFESFNQRGADVTPIMQQATVPAIADERTEQDKRRPSRMAGFINRARAAESASPAPATPAQQAAAGLPADQAPAGEEPPPWEDVPPGVSLEAAE